MTLLNFVFDNILNHFYTFSDFLRISKIILYLNLYLFLAKTRFSIIL